MMHMMGEFVCLFFTCGRDLKPLNFMKDPSHSQRKSMQIHSNGIFSNVLCKSKWTQKKTNIWLDFRLAPHSIIEGLGIIGSIQCHLDARCFHLSTMSTHWNHDIFCEKGIGNGALSSALHPWGLSFFLLVCILLTQGNSQLSLFNVWNFSFQRIEQNYKEKKFSSHHI